MTTHLSILRSAVLRSKFIEDPFFDLSQVGFPKSHMVMLFKVNDIDYVLKLNKISDIGMHGSIIVDKVSNREIDTHDIKKFILISTHKFE